MSTPKDEECFIRIATLDDLEQIVSMSMKFVQDTPYSEYANQETIRDLAMNLVSDNNKSIILLSDHGMIAGLVTPNLFGSGHFATELAWWIDPEYRGSREGSQLLEAFEYWSKLVGCKAINMTCLDDQVGQYYEKKGYRLRERAYIKEI